MYLYYASWGLFRLEKQKRKKTAEKQNSGEAEKQRSRKAKKQRSRKAKKQRSREAGKGRKAKQKEEKQNSGEAEKQKSIKAEAGKSRKAKSREAEKQRSRETEIQKICPKRKKNKKNNSHPFVFKPSVVGYQWSLGGWTPSRKYESQQDLKSEAQISVQVWFILSASYGTCQKQKFLIFKNGPMSENSCTVYLMYGPCSWEFMINHQISWFSPMF